MNTHRWIFVPAFLFFCIAPALTAVEISAEPAQRLIIYLTDKAGKVLQGKSSRDKKLAIWSQDTGLTLTFVHERTGYSWVIAISPRQDRLQIVNLIHYLDNDNDVKQVEVDKLLQIQIPD